MTTTQAVIRLPDDIYTRLKALAARDGRATDVHVREAIEEHLLDAEDLADAERALLKHRKSDEEPLSLEEFDAALGLDGQDRA